MIKTAYSTLPASWVTPRESTALCITMWGKGPADNAQNARISEAWCYLATVNNSRCSWILNTWSQIFFCGLFFTPAAKTSRKCSSKIWTTCKRISEAHTVVSWKRAHSQKSTHPLLLSQFLVLCQSLLAWAPTLEQASCGVWEAQPRALCVSQVRNSV